MANPSLPDLRKDSSQAVGTDNEYFLVTIVDLELGTTYPLEFRWKYKDGTVAENWLTRISYSYISSNKSKHSSITSF
jgi:hypothetical protein